MLLRRITDFILQGRLQAMGTAFACAFIPLVGSVSILIAGLVTLRKGVQEGALVLVAATLPLLISYVGLPVESSGDYTVSPTDAVVIIVIINVLTWVYAVALRRFSSWSLVLQFAGLVSIVAVVTVHVVYPDVQAWWQNWLTNYFSNIEQATGQMTAQDVKTNHGMIANVVTGIAPYATGIVAMALSFYALLELLLSRWWQSAMFNPGGLQKELLEIRMSYAAGALFVLGMLVSYWGGYSLVVDVMPTLYLVFGMAGLSLLHFIAKVRKVNWVWMGLFYIGISLAPMAILLVAMIALLDTWIDFRKRLQKQI
jgi:hypothetical protein